MSVSNFNKALNTLRSHTNPETVKAVINFLKEIKESEIANLINENTKEDLYRQQGAIRNLNRIISSLTRNTSTQDNE